METPALRRILAWLALVSVLVLLAVLTHTNLPGAPNSAFFGWGTASPNNSTCTNGLNDGALYIETDAGSIWVCRTDGDWYDIVSGATGSGSILCVSSAMSATAATCTPSGSISANTRVDFITDTDSDAGGYTLDVGSGAVDVIYYGGDDVGEDDFGANMVQELWYDGSDFIILTARGVGPGRTRTACGTAASTPATNTVVMYCTSDVLGFKNDTGLIFQPIPVSALADAAGADDTILVGAGTTYAAKTIADCDDTAGQHLNYDQGTNAFSCGTSGGGISMTADGDPEWWVWGYPQVSGTAAPGSAASVNETWYAPFFLVHTQEITKLLINVVSGGAGNAGHAIYDSSCNLVQFLGGHSTAGGQYEVTVASPLTLQPGRYYWAISSDRSGGFNIDGGTETTSYYMTGAVAANKRGPFTGDNTTNTGLAFTFPASCGTRSPISSTGLGQHPHIGVLTN